MLFAGAPQTPAGFVSALLLKGTQTGRGLIVLAVLELLSLAFFTSKIVAFVTRARASLRAGEPLEQALRQSLEAAYSGSPALPLFRLALTETLLIYYGVFGSFRRTPATNPDVFSYHHLQDAGTSLALVCIIVLETVPLHFLVQQWSAVAAWLLTGLSLYTLLWLLGDYQALRLKPIRFTATHLRLYAGLRWQANIALEDVAATAPADAASHTCFNSSSKPQLYLHLKRPVPVFGLFGRRTDVTCIGVQVDDPERFRARCEHLSSTRL